MSVRSSGRCVGWNPSKTAFRKKVLKSVLWGHVGGGGGGGEFIDLESFCAV